MKKILFVTNNLETGGVQISLLNLIKEIHTDFDITVCSFYLKENYRAMLPENVKLIGTKSPFRFFGVSQDELKKKPLDFVLRFFWGTLIKVFGRPRIIPLMSVFQKAIRGYDCAVSYLHEGLPKSIYGGCNDFVLRKVNADKKIAWLHCDFEQCGANNSFSKKIYSQFDKIVACSEGCKETFLRCMPEFTDKCISIRNCNDYVSIIKFAGKGIEYDKNVFNIVTVARLGKEKGIDRAIEAVKYCIDKGFKIRYHIIGSGHEESKLKKLVSDYNLGNNIILYGNQTNPYKYMVNADLFLLTSHHEAAPMVFDEAACLGLPVLATRTTSTNEMILENQSGLVCDNSSESIKKLLLDVVENPDKLDIIRCALKKRNFGNKDIVEKFNVTLGN